MSTFLPGRSYLVTGQLEASSLAQILPIDRVEASGEGLAIKELRGILSTAHQRPFGSQRLLIIRQADELGEACQNTLLKVLEEPPATLTIILEARSAEPLLVTVRSRLERVAGAAAAAEAASILSKSENEVAKTLQAVKDRPSLAALLKQELRFQLQNLASLRQPERLLGLEQAITRLERNCNQKLVIDRFLLQWFDETGNG